MSPIPQGIQSVALYQFSVHTLCMATAVQESLHWYNESTTRGKAYVRMTRSECDRKSNCSIIPNCMAKAILLALLSGTLYYAWQWSCIHVNLPYPMWKRLTLLWVFCLSPTRTCRLTLLQSIKPIVIPSTSSIGELLTLLGRTVVEVLGKCSPALRETHYEKSCVYVCVHVCVHVCVCI